MIVLFVFFKQRVLQTIATAAITKHCLTIALLRRYRGGRIILPPGSGNLVFSSASYCYKKCIIEPVTTSALLWRDRRLIMSILRKRMLGIIVMWRHVSSRVATFYATLAVNTSSLILSQFRRLRKPTTRGDSSTSALKADRRRGRCCNLDCSRSGLSA